MNARQQAVARRDEQIAQNVAQIEAAKPRHQSALAAMASRLQISQAALTNTLRNTVFRDANDDEFAALIVVANEYRLNPLTKEIYAFKAKGGGIIPYVSIDGWIRIINEHPQFDGMDFEDIFDGDKLVAIECTIWRKDRTRPIKVAEYMDECYRNTDPWNKSPRRFLRHRSIMQCGRVAFGFSGIGAEEDYEIVGYAGSQFDASDAARPVQPRREAITHTADASPREFDTQRDDRQPVAREEEDEETARRLDAEQEGHGGFDEETGEIMAEKSVSDQVYRELMDKIVSATSGAQIKQVDADFVRHHAAFTEDQIDACERELAASRKRLGAS